MKRMHVYLLGIVLLLINSGINAQQVYCQLYNSSSQTLYLIMGSNTQDPRTKPRSETVKIAPHGWFKHFEPYNFGEYPQFILSTVDLSNEQLRNISVTLCTIKYDKDKGTRVIELKASVNNNTISIEPLTLVTGSVQGNVTNDQITATPTLAYVQIRRS